MRQHEAFYFIEVVKLEKPLPITADQLDETAKPDPKNAEPHYALKIITEITSSESEYTGDKTEATIGSHKTNPRTSFNSGR